MTIYRATVLDTPDSPFTGGRLRAEDDCGIAVAGGVVVDRGPFARVRAARPDDQMVDLTGGVLLPGLVDTHVHFPQVRVIGGLGMPLLDWLAQCALPEEARMADVDYARTVAAEFVDGLVRAGTTTALVFGAHFPAAVDALFERAATVGLRVTAGLVVSDRVLRADLLTTPERAYDDGGRAGRAVARQGPAALRRHPAVLAVQQRGDAGVVRGAAPRRRRRAVHLAHQRERRRDRHRARAVPGALALHRHLRPARARSGGAACWRTTCIPTTPSSTCWPRRARPSRTARRATARWAAVCSRCAGTSSAACGWRWAPTSAPAPSFSLLQEGLQAYFVQSLLGADGLPLTPAHLLYLATAAGAEALGLGEQVGDLSVGKQFDAVWIRPDDGSTLDVVLRPRGRRGRRPGQGVRAGRPGGRRGGVGRRRSAALTLPSTARHRAAGTSRGSAGPAGARARPRYRGSRTRRRRSARGRRARRAGRPRCGGRARPPPWPARPRARPWAARCHPARPRLGWRAMQT